MKEEEGEEEEEEEEMKEEEQEEKVEGSVSTKTFHVKTGAKEHY